MAIPAPHPAEPGFAEIRDAAKRIAGEARRTPLLESPLLNARLGGRLLVKAEPLQRTGSFKFRGAGAASSLSPRATTRRASPPPPRWWARRP
jgi:threonine dehydratase